MSHPNVLEALRNVLDAWPKGAAFCEPGSTLHRLHEAAAALPPGPCVVVPVELVECFVDDNPCRFDHHGYCQEHGFIGSPCGVAQLSALLTAQMPQGEEPC